MRTKSSIGFWLAAACQVLIVLTYVGIKEWTMRSGRDVVLATRPVDPRDVFRGDYVTLAYEVSRLDRCWIGVVGEDVYVPLRSQGEKWVAGYPARTYAEAAGQGEVVMVGKVNNRTTDQCNVIYGIESYYVPQGTGAAIERVRGQLHVRVAVDGFGNAVIKELIMP